MSEPRTDKHGRPIVDRMVSALTWVRVAFVVGAALVAFGAYLTGEVIGARTLEPRVVALEEAHKASAMAMVTRAEKVDATLTNLSVRLAEIKGYVKAIARTTGAEVPQ
jgi:hypothetical protein